MTIFLSSYSANEANRLMIIDSLKVFEWKEIEKNENLEELSFDLNYASQKSFVASFVLVLFGHSLK